MKFEDMKFEDVGMNKNYMREIAKVIGIEWENGAIEGEKFNIVDDGCNPYIICEAGLYDAELNLRDDMLRKLICGECEIEKRPWKPKDGDRYFIINPDESVDIQWFSIGSAYHIAMLKNGWVFITEKEAEANKERVLQEYEEVLKCH